MKQNETKLTKTVEEGVVFYDYNEDTKTLSYLKNHKNQPSEMVVIPLSEMHLSVQKGNIKVGKEFIINTLPGDHYIETKNKPLTNVKGSCQGCCDGCEKFCYAIHGCQQHHNSVMPSVIKNLILYREDRERFLSELRIELNMIVANRKKNKDETPIVLRWHASGEIENYQYLEDMMLIAGEYPAIHFYSYTKRFEYIKKYLDMHGDFPNNFVWNLSVWKDNLEKAGFPEKYFPLVQRFAWDDLDDQTLEKVPHCPSVSYTPGSKKGHLNHDPLPNGLERNCKNCGLCWKGKLKGKILAVYNH